MKMIERHEQELALDILFRMATERRRPWWAFWRPRFRFHHEPLRNAAANFIRQIGYQQMMHVDDMLVGDMTDSNERDIGIRGERTG